MAKVITFSRTFPAYHPKAGQPTYFVEKFWNSSEILAHNAGYKMVCDLNKNLKPDILWPFWNSIKRNDKGIVDEGKHHTIRAGSRWKAGDYFSPRVWSGKPYNSPMITIAPDIKIETIWDFEIRLDGLVCIDGEAFTTKYEKELFGQLAKNDGLELQDLKDWFKYPKPFDGQIICWNKNISY